MNNPDYLYIFSNMAVMALVTYLIRMLPLTLMRKKIRNRFINSFLIYVPYAVLAAMTFPTILYSTQSFISALIGFLTALLLAFFEKKLLTVALAACGAALITELLLQYLI